MGIDEGLFPGPRLQACSPHIETTGNARPHWWYDIRNTGMQVFVDGPEEFRKAVRTQISRGADWIKILPTGGHGITDPRNRKISSDEIKAVVQTAHEMGKRVRAHAAWRELIHECVEAGVDLIDHGDEIDDEIIEMMVERGTYWVPSMRVLDVALGISAGGSVPCRRARRRADPGRARRVGQPGRVAADRQRGGREDPDRRRLRRADRARTCPGSTRPSSSRT